jgi:hypothetical protein
MQGLNTLVRKYYVKSHTLQKEKKKQVLEVEQTNLVVNNK